MVAHAPKAATNSADDEIVRLVQADDRPHEIRVLTSDSTLSDRIQEDAMAIVEGISVKR